MTKIQRDIVVTVVLQGKIKDVEQVLEKLRSNILYNNLNVAIKIK